MRCSFGGHPISGSTLSLRTSNDTSNSSFAIRPLSLFSPIGPPLIRKGDTRSTSNSNSTRVSPRNTSRSKRGSIIGAGAASSSTTSNTTNNNTTSTTTDRLTSATDGSYLNAYLLDTPRATPLVAGTTLNGGTAAPLPSLTLNSTTVLSPPEPGLGMATIQPPPMNLSSTNAVIASSTSSTSTVRGHRSGSTAISSAPPSPPFASHDSDDKDSPLLSFEHSSHATTALGAGVGVGSSSSLARVPELESTGLGLGEGKHSSGAGSRAATSSTSSTTLSSGHNATAITSSSSSSAAAASGGDMKRGGSTSSGGDVSPSSSSSSSARQRKPRRQRRNSFTATFYSQPNVREGYFDPEENRRMVLQSGEDEDKDGGQWVEFKKDTADPSIFKSKSYQELAELADTMSKHRSLVKNRSWRNRSFEQSFIGSELVDWMLTYLRESWGIRDRRTAVILGQSLLECQFIQSMHHSHQEQPHGAVSSSSSSSSSSHGEQQRFHDLHAFYKFDVPPVTIVNGDEKEKKATHNPANPLMSPKGRSSGTTLLTLLGSSSGSSSSAPSTSIPSTSGIAGSAVSPSPPDSPNSAPAPPHPLDIIHQSLALIIDLFRRTAGGEPREIPLRCRHEWHAFVRNVAKLRDAAHQITLEGLDATEMRCFFINAYHTLFVHAIVKYGLPQGRDEWLRFCRQMHYCIGGMNFSLLDIEYAILRAKLPMSHLKQRDQLVVFAPKFTASDTRYKFSTLDSDPRLSFALCNGTAESPDIRVFTVDTMDTQLTQASQLYIKDYVRFQYIVHHNYPFLEVLVPGQFYLYRWEIGKADNKILQWIADYHWDWVEQSKIMDFLHAKAFTVQFKAYDWTPSLTCFLRSTDRTQELERDDE